MRQTLSQFAGCKDWDVEELCEFIDALYELGRRGRMSDELKHCWFCGGEASRIAARQREDGTYYPAACGCRKCGIWRYGESDYGHSGFATEEDFKASMEQAVAKWNTRVGEFEQFIEKAESYKQEDEQEPLIIDGDTREKLEADVRKAAIECKSFDEWVECVTRLLDRQAAITKRECYESEAWRIGISREAVENGLRISIFGRDYVPADLAVCVEGTDTREQLEVDMIKLCHMDMLQARPFLELLDRQEAITKRQCEKREDEITDAWQSYLAEVEDERDELKERLERANKSLSTIGIIRLNARIDELEAGRDGLLEQRDHWFDEAVAIYRRFYPHDEYAIPQNIAGMVLAKIDELTAERDELRGRLDAMKAVLDKWVKLTEGIELPDYPRTEFQPKDKDRRIAELTAERDEWRARAEQVQESYLDAKDSRDNLQAAIDAMENGQFYAMYRKACEERERLEHANNTLRVSAAGLKLAVEKLTAELDALKASGR